MRASNAYLRLMAQFPLKSLVKTILSFTAPLLLAGCGLAVFEESMTAHGPKPLIYESEHFEKIDLALLLNPMAEDSQNADTLFKHQKRLQKAFDIFYTEVNSDGIFYTEENSEKLQNKRNRLQERIIAASNQRCARYKQFLNRFSTESNFLAGSLATIFAGAGAIFTPESTVRILSGFSGLTSGVQAEFNDKYFAAKTVQLLTEAMEARRRERYEAIAGVSGGDPKPGRQALCIQKYPVEAAIKDAISYHDDCSLIAALEHAALSIERAENPGIKQIMRTLSKVKEIQKQLKDINKAELSSNNDEPSPSDPNDSSQNNNQEETEAGNQPPESNPPSQ